MKISFSDGYEELAAKEAVGKKPKESDIFTKRRKEKQREVEEYRKEEMKLKKPNDRSMKTLHPRGSGSSRYR